MKKLLTRRYLQHPVIVNAAIIASAIVFVVGAQWVSARGTLRPAEQASPLHPAIMLLDAQEKKVADTGEPISTLKTCGACHDQEAKDYADCGERVVAERRSKFCG